MHTCNSKKLGFQVIVKLFLGRLSYLFFQAEAKYVFRLKNYFSEKVQGILSLGSKNVSARICLVGCARLAHHRLPFRWEHN